MEGKYWKIWTKALWTTFTKDGKKLVRALGDWLKEVEESQQWTTNRDKATTVSYMAPDRNNPTRPAHETVTATDQFLKYNHTPGRPCNPPKHAIKISLYLKTTFTFTYGNINTIKVFIKYTMMQKANPNNRAMERFMGL